MKTYPKPLDVLLSELIGDIRATPEFVHEILRALPDSERFRLRNSSRDELISLLNGEYPTSLFYTSLCAALREPETGLSEELRRVLVHLDPETLLVNDAKLLQALEIIMTLPVRKIVSELNDDLLAIVCDGRMNGDLTASGSYCGVVVTVEIPPALDTFLEMLFHIVETRA